MTEAEAISQINADAAEAETLANSLALDADAVHVVSQSVDAAVDAARVAVSVMESNIRYAMRFLRNE